MKRLKLSWLIVLSVVLATGSAFTTTDHLGKAVTKSTHVTDLWYANDAHNTGNPLSSAQVDAAVSYTDAQVTSAFLTAHCPPASIICLAKFQQGPTGNQIDFKSGRYQ